jgi:dTDP-4-amino-4,6-dideoxygalactose transaminase
MESKNKNPRIWISPPHMGGKELQVVWQAFADNWIAPMGPCVDGFEHDLEAFLGNDSHVVALNSGTSALHLALIMAGVERGDTVICQTMTFSASVNPIIYLGATPVFVDSERKTGNISPELLQEAIEDCIRKEKKPKAMIVVDLYGMSAQWDEIIGIARQYDIPIIEDAAEALGASYKNKRCGLFGTFGILSFNGNKIITTSGGGALVCQTREDANTAHFLATQARDAAPYYQHSHIGYNYRLSNISAAIGRGQMEVLIQHIQSRRNNHNFYRKALSRIPGVTLREEPDTRYFSNYWLNCIFIDPALTPSGADREAVRIRLRDIGIESRPLWKPMHLQPIFQSYPFYGDGTAEDFFNKGLCLPSGSSLKHADLDEICSNIRQLLLP